VTTGTGMVIGVRMLDRPIAALDAWINKHAPGLTRPEAIRRLVEMSLIAETSAKPSGDTARSSRAAELAAKQIEKMIDPSATADERDQRRRRLTKGPPEFRDDRVDRPKPKGQS